MCHWAEGRVLKAPGAGEEREVSVVTLLLLCVWLATQKTADSISGHEHAARVYSTWSVCLSVCLSVCSYSDTSGYEAANEWYQQLPNYAILKYYNSDFPETTVFERCAMKSEKANKRNCSGLLQPHPLALCTLDALTTKDMYRLQNVYLLMYLACVRLSASY